MKNNYIFSMLKISNFLDLSFGLFIFRNSNFSFTKGVRKIDYSNSSTLKNRIFVGATLLIFLSFYPLGKIFSQSTQTIPSGSYIINMGIIPQTIGNGIKPYGLIYDLLKNYNVPIIWVINPNKTKDGADFSYNGTDYKGGPFIISAEYRSTAVNNRITYWNSLGVVGTTTTSTIQNVPVYTILNFAPRWTLNDQNSSISEGFFTDAGIPSSAYNFILPENLSCCEDVYVMPHADPTWATHGNLYNWNLTCKGAIWTGCHAGSALADCYNPAVPSQQMNFLSTTNGTTGPPGETKYYENSLLLWGNHKNGDPPYEFAYPSDPAMQFMGTTQGAQEGGSEQSYLPVLGASWRTTTRIGVWDPDHPDIPTKSLGPAAKIVYGPGFGDPNRGQVMIEAGHDVGGSGTGNVAAVRAFFNFSINASRDKAINVNCTGIPAFIPGGQSFPVSVNVSPSGGNYTYSWSSTCGGTFGNTSTSSTTFTPPTVETNTTCVLTCVVTDVCGRTSFCSQSFVIECSIANFGVSASPSIICKGESSTLSVTGLGSTFPESFPSDGNPITINNNTTATPYPKTINVSGLPINGITVNKIQFSGLTHDEPQDLDIYLVGPNNQSIWLTSDAGGSNTISNFNLTFQDGGTPISTSAFINNGTYSPGNLGTGDVTPPGTLITSLSQFSGTYNGNWSLYIIDDSSTGSGGTMANWSITFNVPYSYSWSNGPTTASQIVTPDVTTTYTVTVTTGNCIGAYKAIFTNMFVKT